MNRGAAFAVTLSLLMSMMSLAYAVSDKDIAAFVEQEAYTIADKLKLRDLDRTKTRVEITEHRKDSSGIHWLAGDVKVFSQRYGACAVALQLKFVDDEGQIYVVGSKGVLAALDLNKGVEKYRAKLIEYKKTVKSQGKAIVIEVD